MEPKVLFTASTSSHILNFHLPYLRAFQERGWTVHAACGGTQVPIPFAEEVIPLPLEKSMGSPRNFRAAAILRDKIQTEGYGLVSAHTSLAAFFTRLALRGMKRRPAVMNMCHGYLFDDATPYLRRQLLLTAERWMAPQTDLLLTMNQWDFDAARRYQLGRKVVHIPGVGVDFSRLARTNAQAAGALRAEWEIPAEAFVLLYPAEFSRRKSQAVLIRAMPQLPEQTVLVLAGDGALRQECRTLADTLGLSRRVIFPGHVSDMAPWYATADAAVSASRSEGLPFNIMEAMYAGLPVTASSVKGHVDLIADGETGLLYPYGDPDAFAAQIRRLLESETLRRTLAKQAAERAAQYAIEQVFPLVWAQYAALSEEEVSV